MNSVEFFWNDPLERAKEVRDFFGGIGGRLKSFYLPTFTDDIVPLAGVYAGTTLSVQNTGTTTDYLDRAVMIELLDGTKTYNTINSVTDQTTYYDLILDTAISLDTVNLKRVSFLNLVRADMDDFEMSYTFGRGGTVRFNTIEVPN